MSMVLDRLAATLAVDQIGRNQSITPEGFLLCSDVRIARTGPMMYADYEMPDIPPEPGRHMVTIDRTADVLFHPDAILSFAGKPVTNDHPSKFVTPSTWRQDSIGVVLNPRRGEGIDADYMIADLLITHQDAIDDVRAGKREVSCGYDAKREAVRPGLGRQVSVVGNHVALVDRGRCGPSCAITDSEKGIIDMVKRSAWDRVRDFMKAGKITDAEEELQKLEDADGDDDSDDKKEKKETEDAIKRIVDAALRPIADKLGTLDTAVTKIVKDAEKDDEEEEKKKAEDKRLKDAEAEEEKKKQEDAARKVTDSAPLASAFNDTLSRAEILFPGITFPVFDAKAKSTATNDAMCALRVQALDKAFSDPARRKHVLAVLGGKAPEFSKMTCDAAEVVFTAASELARAAQVADTAGDRSNRRDPAAGPMTAAKMQARIEAFRKKA
jgi:hypothetical protein